MKTNINTGKDNPQASSRNSDIKMKLDAEEYGLLKDNDQDEPLVISWNNDEASWDSRKR